MICHHMKLNSISIGDCFILYGRGAEWEITKESDHLYIWRVVKGFRTVGTLRTPHKEYMSGANTSKCGIPCHGFDCSETVRQAFLNQEMRDILK